MRRPGSITCSKGLLKNMDTNFDGLWPLPQLPCDLTKQHKNLDPLLDHITNNENVFPLLTLFARNKEEEGKSNSFGERPYETYCC